MKRHYKFFALWGALALFGFYVAGQIWYEAAVEVGERHNRLASTGLDAWPFVNSILWLSVAGIVAVAFTSGLTRTVLLWALTVMNAAQAVLFVVQGSFNKTPPGLNDEIEHRTGIHFESGEILHDAFVSTHISVWPLLFFAALLLMFIVTSWAAIASMNWSKQDRQSRFEPGTQRDQKPAEDSDDPIDLWDSQR